MKLHTASEVISLFRLRENEAAEYYERLAKAAPACSEVLAAFARENRRNVVQVQQAYNSVISDALEGGYAFDIEANDFEIELPKDATPTQIVKASASIETRLARLYSVAAEQSSALLPDVSRAMSVIAKKRQARVEKLRDLA